MCFREQHHLHFRSSERLYMPVLRITYSQQHYRLLFPGVSELYRTIFQMYIPVRLHHFLWPHPSRLQQSALCYRTLDYQEFLLTDYYNTHYNLIRHFPWLLDFHWHHNNRKMVHEYPTETSKDPCPYYILNRQLRFPQEHLPYHSYNPYF